MNGTESGRMSLVDSAMGGRAHMRVCASVAALGLHTRICDARPFALLVRLVHSVAALRPTQFTCSRLAGEAFP